VRVDAWGTESHYRTFVARWRGGVLNVISVGALGFLLVPLLIVVVISFSSAPYLSFPPPGFSLRWYRNFFYADETWLAAAWVSVRVAFCAMVAATVLGTALAFPLSRRQFRGRSFVEWLVLAPMIVPVIVSAVAFYGFFAPLKAVGSLAVLMVAHTVLALPFVVLYVSPAVRTFDERLEQAAMSLGAGPFYTLRRVTLPLIAPAVFSGALVAFLTSFDEVVVALFLSGLNPTLPKRMWDDIRLEINPTIAAVSTLLVAVTVLLFVLLAVLRAASRRRTSGDASPVGNL
jgi:putative spermidine/putrescine transport system permease protein